MASTLTIEDGTGVPGADAYDTLANCSAFAAEFYGAHLPGSDAVKDAAIRRAVKYLDNLPWKGLRTHGRDQELAWPRTGVVDPEGHSIGSEEIPREVKFAQHRLARAEFQTPGILDAEFVPGQSVKREKVGELEVEYNSPAVTREAARATVAMAMDEIDGLLQRSPNTGSGGISGYSVRA